ncbi:integrin alpha-M-like [Xyrauchen texanus]|uniref:integrin alpha-M-like n=1 Tax=Xyrauchen texanus TaxID=154827 RepID=UPI00224284F2|nr:integrin alpha-M-like [Xyrauchen texanus]
MNMETLTVLLFIWVFTVSKAFNIDIENPLSFTGKHEDFFGYSVYQYESEHGKQIIVGAPFGRNSSGDMYTCSTDLLHCTLLASPGSESVRSFGISAAVSSPGAGNITICSPHVTRECDGNSYLNAVCYQFNSKLQPISNFTASLQECTKASVDVVFLFDGSNSMKSDEFDMNKRFIKDIMRSFSNSSIKFAAVQFSSRTRTVFDFNDFLNNTAEEKLNKEHQMSTLSQTYFGINYVLSNLFNNQSSGADLNATKVLLIITDGDPTDRDTKSVLKRCDEQNILRFVIGVGTIDLKKLTSLASVPKQNNTFYIQDYAGLKGIIDDLKNKIDSVEGSLSALTSDRQNEISSRGFSVVSNKDSVIVGSVGSNEQCGVLYEVTDSGSGFRKTEIKDAALSKDSYMGYSTVVGHRGDVSLLFSGGPSFEHRGLVTLFTNTENTWRVTGRITGEQIRSYFGASLSLLDVDLDGNTDFLLVGAPLFYQPHPRREGRMYVYALTEQFILQQILTVSESPTGRFAASLASLKDLNGDNVPDVAVGAPLEDEWGVVYIYLGERKHGIRPTRTPQRIAARSVLPGIHQFGVSLSGQMDMSDDNLPDIVVGAQGAIVLLKARPVISVSSQLSFNPHEISLKDFECPSADVFLAFNLTSCFNVTERTISTGSVIRSLNVTINLYLDDLTKTSRAFFDPNHSSSRTLQRFILLDDDFSCFTFPIFMARCVADTLSPLKIRMNFWQTRMMVGHSMVVLDIDSRTEENAEMLFQRSCKSMNISVANQTLNFSLITVAVRTTVPPVTISVDSSASADTKSTVAVRTTVPPVTVPVDSSASAADTTSTVAVRTTVTPVTVPVDSSASVADTISTVAVRKTVPPVTISVDSSASAADTKSVDEDSLMYVNFSLEDRDPKPLIIIYRVENLGTRSMPVSVTLLIPCPTAHVILIPHSFIMLEVLYVHSVIYDQIMMCSVNTISSTQNSKKCQFIKEPQDGHCGHFKCLFQLQNISAVHFNMTAHATLHNIKQYETKYSFYEFRMNSVFKISAELDYNKTHYKQTSTDPKHNPHKSQTTVNVEFFIAPSRGLIVGTSAVAGVIICFILVVMLVKCGFFKRKHPHEIWNLQYFNVRLVEFTTSEEDSTGPDHQSVVQTLQTEGIHEIWHFKKNQH